MFLYGDMVFGDEMPMADIYEGELWASTDYEEIYVSDCGRVFNGRTQRFLKPKPMDRQGHLGVSFSRNGRMVYVYVHRLMAKAFIPNPDNKPIVRHLNDEKWYNTIDNLAWGTQLDNHRDRVKNGHFVLLSPESRERQIQNRRKPVVVTNIRSGERRLYASLMDACRELGLQQANAWKVVSGERTHTKGYHIRYFIQEDEYD